MKMKFILTLCFVAMAMLQGDVMVNAYGKHRKLPYKHPRIGYKGKYVKHLQVGYPVPSLYHRPYGYPKMPGAFYRTGSYYKTPDWFYPTYLAKPGIQSYYKMAALPFWSIKKHYKRKVGNYYDKFSRFPLNFKYPGSDIMPRLWFGKRPKVSGYYGNMISTPVWSRKSSLAPFEDGYYGNYGKSYSTKKNSNYFDNTKAHFSSNKGGNYKHTPYGGQRLHSKYIMQPDGSFIEASHHGNHENSHGKTGSKKYKVYHIKPSENGVDVYSHGGKDNGVYVVTRKGPPKHAPVNKTLDKRSSNNFKLSEPIYVSSSADTSKTKTPENKTKELRPEVPSIISLEPAPIFTAKDIKVKLEPIRVPNHVIDDPFPCPAPAVVVCGARRPWSPVLGINQWCQRNCPTQVFNSNCDFARCRCKCVSQETDDSSR